MDTFSGWVEAFPTKREIVVKKIIDGLIPRYGLPSVIGSDNGPDFTSKITSDSQDLWEPPNTHSCYFYLETHRLLDRATNI